MFQKKTDRRQFLARSVLGAAAIGAAHSGIEDYNLLAATQDGTAQTGESERPKTDIPPGSLPCGKIRNVSVSRLLIGGNLMAGCAHSRDLIYVSKLFKAYNTEAKVLETLELAQQCGINTILIDPSDWGTVRKYNQRRSNKIQTLLSIRLEADKAKMSDQVKRLIDEGATLMYPQGMECDEAVLAGKIDLLGRAIDVIKGQGVPAGVGSHSLQTPLACEKNKLNPDFYVKTFHMDRYWSAIPKANREEWCWYKGGSSDHDKYFDNMWCLDPEATAAFMETVEKPWVAFKVMAAGAIPPRMAFPYAYRHGADFIAAGMFDFQVEDDVKMAIDSLQKVGSRRRPWRG